MEWSKLRKVFDFVFIFFIIGKLTVNYWSENPIFYNKTFQIVFDLPTPRPHLIILFNDVNYKQIKKPIKDFSADEVDSLLSCVEEFASMMDLNEFTLSLHTGYWVWLQKTLHYIVAWFLYMYFTIKGQQFSFSCTHLFGAAQIHRDILENQL